MDQPMCYGHFKPSPMVPAAPRMIPGPGGIRLAEWIRCPLCGHARPTGRVRRQDRGYEVRRPIQG